MYWLKENCTSLKFQPENMFNDFMPITSPQYKNAGYTTIEDIIYTVAELEERFSLHAPDHLYRYILNPIILIDWFIIELVIIAWLIWIFKMFSSPYLVLDPVLHITRSYLRIKEYKSNRLYGRFTAEKFQSTTLTGPYRYKSRCE